MYSSVSLALVGDNTLVEDLRIITSVELFLNSDFYASHPSIISAFNKFGDKISVSLKNVLPLCLSFDSLVSHASPQDLIKNEAVLNCENRRWSSYLCMLALSSVTSSFIFSHYPDCGEEKFKLLFNAKIEPHIHFRTSSDIHILFCFQGRMKPGFF